MLMHTHKRRLFYSYKLLTDEFDSVPQKELEGSYCFVDHCVFTASTHELKLNMNLHYETRCAIIAFVVSWRVSAVYHHAPT